MFMSPTFLRSIRAISAAILLNLPAFAAPDPIELLEQRFKLLDLDKDGKLNAEEAKPVAIWVAGADANKDGLLTMDEIRDSIQDKIKPLNELLAQVKKEKTELENLPESEKRMRMRLRKVRSLLLQILSRRRADSVQSETWVSSNTLSLNRSSGVRKHRMPWLRVNERRQAGHFQSGPSGTIACLQSGQRSLTSERGPGSRQVELGVERSCYEAG